MKNADAIWGWTDQRAVIEEGAEQDWDALIEDGERAVDEIENERERQK